MAERRNSSSDTFSLKFVVLGSTGVGKTQLALRFCKNNFSDKYIATEGMEYSTKAFTINGLSVKAQIWNISGGTVPEKMTKAYFKRAVGAIFVYDSTNKNSFDDITNVWMKQLRAYGNEEMKAILIANKVDESAKSVVSREQGLALASALGLPFAETSALSSLNVDLAFRHIVYSVSKSVTDLDISSSQLPQGWVVKRTEGSRVDYENILTGQETTRRPTFSDTPGEPSPVVVPVTAITGKTEPRLVSRNSIVLGLEMQDDKDAAPKSIFHNFPQCCTMQ